MQDKVSLGKGRPTGSPGGRVAWVVGRSLSVGFSLDARRRRGLFGGVPGVLLLVAVVVAVLLVLPAVVEVSGPAGVRQGPVGVSVQVVSAGGVAFSPSGLAVRSGIPVEFVIVDYDTAVHVVPSTALRVVGTLGLVASYRFGPSSAPDVLVGLPAGEVSQTFTVGLGPRVVNVPLLAAPAPGSPSVVTFSVVFLAPGSLVWFSYAEPGGSGSASGSPYGVITVT